MSFAENLKKLRKEHKMTQEELGKMIGKSNRVISYYENEEGGSTTPPSEMVEKLARIFKVTPESLLENDPDDLQEKFVRSLIDSTLNSEIEWYQLTTKQKDVKEAWAISAVRKAMTELNLMDDDGMINSEVDPIKSYFCVLNNVILLVDSVWDKSLYVLNTTLTENNDVSSVRIVEVKKQSLVADLQKYITGDNAIIEELILNSTLEFLNTNKK